MAYRVKKTEHAGAKKGRGFWGRKAEAKFQSSRTRRREGKLTANSWGREIETDLDRGRRR